MFPPTLPGEKAQPPDAGEDNAVPIDTTTQSEPLLEYPSGKLSVVTRKKNELCELMKRIPLVDRETFHREYAVYCERVDSLLSACDAEINKSGATQWAAEQVLQWKTKVNTDISTFREIAMQFIQKSYPTTTSGPKVNNDRASVCGSVQSVHSNASSAQSLRVKLAEQRAKREADELYLREKELLDDKKAKLEKDMAALELQKQKNIESNLAKEIEALEKEASSSNSVRDSIASSKKNSSNDQNIIRMLMNAQERSMLPKNEPTIFDGTDLTQFKTFIIAFETLIASRCDKSADKLYYLERYTTGNPKKIVQSCLGKNADLAYKRALELLHGKYGNEFKIGETYLQQLEQWPSIRANDGKALEEFSVFLMRCESTMDSSDMLNQLNSPKEIMEIIRKLPYGCREKWRVRAHKLIHKGLPVTFRELVKFVDLQSSIVNLPVFSDIKDDDRRQVQTKRRAFAVKLEDGEIPDQYCESRTAHAISCSFCKKTNHKLDSCIHFNRKSHEEKIEYLRSNNLCFACLRYGHRSSGCTDKMECSKCMRKHPTCLHNDGFSQQPRLQNQSTRYGSEIQNIELQGANEPRSVDGTDSTVLAMKCTADKGAGVCKTICAVIPVKVRVQGTERFIETYMALDNFSTDCFLDQELMKNLGVKGNYKEMSLTTMEKSNKNYSVQVINNLEVTDLDGNEGKIIPVLFATANWPFTADDSPRPQDVAALPYLSDVPFSFLDCKIGLLVGANMPSLIRPLRVLSRHEDEPYASLHKLGWALNGPVRGIQTSSKCHRIKVCDHEDLNEKIQSCFARDFEECQDDAVGPSIKDRMWTTRIENSIKQRDDGHFEIGLPFEETTLFPSNRHQALKRLDTLKSRFLKNEKFFTEYKSFMRSMLENNFAEAIPQEEILPFEGNVWYLVHHGVYHPQKQKLRVVFDCSLKHQGVSLNDKLLQGPDLTNNLLGVLLRFRQSRIAVLADIEKMYYQVKVSPADKDYMRFLWFPNGDMNADPVDYRITVHVFGAKSSPSCASYALRRTADAEGDFCLEARQAIGKDFYVDDFVKSVDCPLAARQIIDDVERLLAGGGFNLTGFVSNSPAALSSLPPTKRKHVTGGELVTGDDAYLERALGVLWNVGNDEFEFSVGIPGEVLTKRGVLSTIFSIYDPFGFASPVTLSGKLIFQRASLAGLEWDSELPLDISVAWRSWRQDIQLLSRLKVERCLQHEGTIKSVELHVFCDGSEVGYGVAAYVRIHNNTGDIVVNLVLSKSRLLPAGKSALTTIPRIELAAAHLAVKIKNILVREMEFEWSGVHMWSDSMTVLKYIGNEDKRFQRFVSNKIAFIRAHTTVDQWHHVSSGNNPADLASRGSTVAELQCRSYWFKGPSFLHEESEWSIVEPASDVEESDVEIRRVKTLVTNHCAPQESNVLFKLLNSCSNWHKMKLRIAAIIRVKNTLLHRETKSGNFSITELDAAEKCILKLTQQLYLSSAIESLRKREELPKKHPLSKLSPFIDDYGLLRVGGRLSRAQTSLNVKHPIILPKECHAALLLAREAHQRLGHMGKATILANIRQSYWIIKGNTLVKGVVRDCILCRKLHGRPSSQIMADLPEDRLKSDEKVFANVGLDCFGPLLVSRGRGKSMEKRYGVIFSCLSSRAVHLELAHSLDTDSFLSAMSRFMARRGPVNIIRSDNGTNFTSGQKELKEALESWNKNSSPWMLQRNIDWKFQPPAASHFGGIWEREIRTIRQVLGGLTNNQNIRMTDERLNTLMCEIENILNNRPITELSDDPNDLEPLTPNHILLAATGVTFPPGLFTMDDLYGKRRWRQVQYLADLFWARWRKEYLPLLQVRQKWTTKKSPHKVGDLVLLVDQLLPRNQWSTGRITQVIEDKQGNVRSAKITVAKIRRDKYSLQAKAVSVERPITKLILLKPV